MEQEGQSGPAEKEFQPDPVPKSQSQNPEREPRVAKEKEIRMKNLQEF
jgi:hypothetical protein